MILDLKGPMLRKQGWKLTIQQVAIVSRAFKAKYISDRDLLGPDWVATLTMYGIATL